MTFEEILPRLKAGHTCYRITFRRGNDSVSIRGVPGTYDSGQSSPIGFIAIRRVVPRSHHGHARESFAEWTPAFEDMTADDWQDMTASLEATDRREATRGQEPAAP